MTTKKSRVPATQTRVAPGGTQLQVGPWMPAETLQVHIMANGGDLLRMVATAADPRVTSPYISNEEYWAAGNLSGLSSLTPGDALHMMIESKSCTNGDLDAFFEGYANVLKWSEAPPTWQQSAHSLVEGQVAHYFALPDLDAAASGRRVGLSLVVASGVLVGVGWHKSFNPGESGMAWTPPALGLLRSYLCYVGTASTALAIPSALGWWNVYQGT